MNELQIFKNNEFGEIRTIIDKNGNPFFCLKDVCDILEIGNSRDVKKRLDSDGVDTIDMVVNSGLGEQKVQMTFINESNLYDCIFQSRKEEAKPFEKPVLIKMAFNSGLDVSNHGYLFKLIEDSLVKCGVIQNDSYKYVKCNIMALQKAFKGVIVEVEEISE
jgi:hypothetical protein|nr:MAG TPA: hypothetical protein [Caudoviricetes sp.]